MWSRREFVKFVGAGTVGSVVSVSSSCGTVGSSKRKKPKRLKTGDRVHLLKPLQYNLLVQENDSIGPGLRFGSWNDFTQFIPQSSDQALLWVNHEGYSTDLLVGRSRKTPPTLAQYKTEAEAIGGSLLKLRKHSGTWKLDPTSLENYRLTADTPIELDRSIRGASSTFGTLANCSGGLTPWKTILTCEENYDKYVGEYKAGGQEVYFPKKSKSWHKLQNRVSAHFGWVVEFDPVTKKSVKRTGLGRFSHECAHVVTQKKDSPSVVYSGDDREGGCLYKFIASEPGSLKNGTLYVAHLESGTWLALDVTKNEKLKKKFKTQEELLIRTREAAKFVGATPLARPEDIEHDPSTGAIFVSLTNDKSQGNFHGSILKIQEDQNNPQALKFKSSNFINGGDVETGFSCPDNLCFDPSGNLWITSDISDKSIGKKHYSGINSNGLFVIPKAGAFAGEVICVATAPVDAEFTGPCFTPDGEHLFLSVQHPGDSYKLEHKKYPSNWPRGGNSKPLSSVIVITGDFKKAIS